MFKQARRDWEITKEPFQVTGESISLFKFAWVIWIICIWFLTNPHCQKMGTNLFLLKGSWYFLEKAFSPLEFDENSINFVFTELFFRKYFKDLQKWHRAETKMEPRNHLLNSKGQYLGNSAGEFHGQKYEIRD